MTTPEKARESSSPEDPGAGAGAWIAEAAAVFAKDWRSEFRTRYALNTLALFALTTLVTVSFGLGPLGTSPTQAETVLPVILWIVLLFAALAGLPRVFVHEEETYTATALRLAAEPSALFCGKLVFGLTLILALEAMVTPLFVAMVQLQVGAPGHLIAVLAAGGVGLAAGSTLIAAIIAQARGRTTLFAVVALPVLLPLVLLLIDATRSAVVGDPPGMVLAQLVLYDAVVTLAGLMLFPVVWSP